MFPADRLTTVGGMLLGPTTRAAGAPGPQLTAYGLSEPVVTCVNAARARGIRCFVAAHLPGDGVLSVRKVKDRLAAAEARLADPEDLEERGLSAGTVSAVLEPVWSLPHLASRRLLELTAVCTKAGTRKGYFRFDPAVLLQAPEVMVADLERLR